MSALDLINKYGSPGVSLNYLRKHSGLSDEELRSIFSSAWRQRIIHRGLHASKQVYYWLPKDDEEMAKFNIFCEGTNQKLVPDTPKVECQSRPATVDEMQENNISVIATAVPKERRNTKVGYFDYDNPYIGFVKEVDTNDIEPAIHSKLAKLKETSMKDFSKQKHKILEINETNHPWRLPKGETPERKHAKAEFSDDAAYDETLLGLTITKVEEQHGNQNKD